MTACACPERYPDWHGTHQDLGGRCVFETSTPMFMHMPIGFDLKLAQQSQAVQNLGLQETWPGLVFVRTGWFSGRLLRLLEKGDAPARQIRYLPKPFHVLAWLHQGDIGTVRQTLVQMQKELIKEGRLPKEWYLAYLTCPACAETKGGPKIMVLRRFLESPRLKARTGTPG